jgi:hypothetical protein
MTTTETEQAALQLARVVWTRGHLHRDRFRGIRPEYANEWIDRAVHMKWVIIEGDLIKKGQVDPTPPPEPISWKEARRRWGPSSVLG